VIPVFSISELPKIAVVVSVASFLAVGPSALHAQSECNAQQILQPGNCVGDGLDALEIELALLAHQVTAALADLATLQGQLQTGTLRALATTAAARVPVLPNVPTAIESGYNDVEAEFYIGVVAPAKTPRVAISQTIRWFSDAIRVAEIKAKFVSLGFVPGGQCGIDFGAIIGKDYAKYGRTIREARLQMH
jgi:tripartite-type tricarboxylate transporter receptor subunit TctC